MRKDFFELHARFVAAASVVGKKEHEGPLGDRFDLFDSADRFGAKSWEAAESEMQRRALSIALGKSGLKEDEIGALFAGDLLNQCVGSAYGLMDFDIPYFGLYGACSTSGEGLLLASLAVSGGFCDYCAAVTSSHYCAAERQYRTPLEYGAQRPPTAQWTVTGSGAFLVESAGKAPVDSAAARVIIRRGMAGRVKEMGIKDANNMGAAMAPAAADTLLRFFAIEGNRLEDYDLIVTGDLGYEGGDILCELLRLEGLQIADRYSDCGQRIFFREGQDVHGGGSGCGCSAVVLAAELIPGLASGKWRKILFLPTGAMMSPDSIKQGQCIPAVAHLLELVNEEAVK